MCGQSVEANVDKEIRTDTGLVRILHRPMEGETVSVLLSRRANVTEEDHVHVSKLQRMTFASACNNTLSKFLQSFYCYHASTVEQQANI